MTRMSESKIASVNGYMKPVVKEETKTITFYQVKGERYLKESTAKSVSRRLPDVFKGVQEVTAPTTVFTVNDEVFLEKDKAETRLRSLLKNHRDRVRNVGRRLGMYKASQTEKNETIKWLMENYALEDFEELDFAYAFAKDVGDKDTVPLAKDIPKAVFHWNPEVNRFKWEKPGEKYVRDGLANDAEESAIRASRYDLMRKLEEMDDLIRYRTAELMYKLASEHAETDEDGEVVSVLPLQMVVNLLDTDLLIEELKDIFAFLDKGKMGENIEIKTFQYRVQYWDTSDKKNLNPFKKF